MKQLLVKAIACAAVLLPLSTVQAKTYGGWEPGKTFKFKVTEKISVKADLTNKPVKCPVPNGIPNYSKGDTIKFTIGPKGQLQGPDGLVLPFKQDGGSANVYETHATKTNPHANVGQVFKDAKNKPTAVTLEFFKVKIAGFSTTTYTVSYALE